MADDNFSWRPIPIFTRTRVCPKGRKHIGGGEAPVYEKYQTHSPNGAVEIEELLWLVRLWKRNILEGRTDMERFQSANHQKKNDSIYSRPKTSPQENIVSRGIY